LIGFDTNLLVSAHIPHAQHHPESSRLLQGMVDSGIPFAIFWPTLYGYLRITTHPRIFTPALSTGKALADIAALVVLPGVQVLGETPRHPEFLQRVLKESGATGNLVHDAHLVALALEHGVDEILTFDGDFARFPQVRSRHPFRP
jgi:toxin-antitoxin system PIN domain toxin